jgi:hypothetical protein
VGEKAYKGPSDRNIVQIFEKFLRENDKTITIRKMIETISQNMVEEGQRAAKLRAAYRMLRPYVCLDNIAEVTGLELTEVVYLLEIARIRKKEQERNNKQMAKKIVARAARARKNLPTN